MLPLHLAVVPVFAAFLKVCLVPAVPNLYLEISYHVFMLPNL